MRLKAAFGVFCFTTVYPTSTHGAHGNSGGKSAGKDVFGSGKGRKCPEISGNRYSQILWEQAGEDAFTVRAYFDGDLTYKPASAEFQVKVNPAFQVNNIDRDFTGSPIEVDLNETGYGNGVVIYYDAAKQIISAPTNPNDYYYRVKDGSFYSNYATLCVKPIAPNVTYPIAKEGLVYNGAEQELITAYNSEHGTWWYSNITIFDSPLFISNTFPKAKDAGTYTWWCKFEGKTGYNDIEPFPIEVNISPKPISVDLTSANITKAYDGTAVLENVELVLEGIEDGDSLQATATITYNDKNAGTDKSVSATNIVLSGSSAQNYTAEGVFPTGTGAIVPLPITVKVNDASKIYGDSDPIYTYELTEDTSLVENDVLTGIEYTRAVGDSVLIQTTTTSSM